MKDHIGILRQLKREVDSAIAIADGGHLVSMTDSEAESYKRRFGDFDLIVGNFGIKQLASASDAKG